MVATPLNPSTSATTPIKIASTSISILPSHVSHFSESKETNQKAPANQAAYNWQIEQLNSILDFASVAKRGCSWSNPIYKNGHREQTSVVEATTLTVEFDDVVLGSNDWETLAPKTRAFAAIPSPSHYTGNAKHDAGGYRLVFRLNRKVNGGELKALVAEVMQSLNFDEAAVDTACKDCARFWYGASGADLLWESQENWDNPLEVDQMLSDRAKRLGISSITQEITRYLSGFDDGVVKLSCQADFYLLYGVQLPKEWQKSSRHEALQGLQQAFTAIRLDELAVEIRQAVRGDSEPLSESKRQISDSKSYVENRASNGLPFVLPAVNNINHYRRTSRLIEDLEVYEPTQDSKSAFDWNVVGNAFPSDLRLAIKQQSELLGTPLHTLSLAVLAALTADLSGKAAVKVNPATYWYEPLILWVAVVGEPGSAKTPFLKQLEKPLVEMNKLYIEDYKKALKEYEKECRAIKENGGDEPYPEKPTQRYAFLGQPTTEKLIKTIVSNREDHDTGFMILIDELAAWLGALNKRGGSDDTAVFLQAWNGGAINKSTIMGGDLFADKGCCSILGGVQDYVWLDYCKKLSGKGDQNGFAGRWLTAYVKREDRKNVQIGSHHEASLLPHCILNCLKSFSEIPSGTLIGFGNNDDGQRVEDYFNYMSNKSENPNLWLKGKSNVFRIAGLLSLLKQENSISFNDLHAATLLVHESIRQATHLNRHQNEKSIDCITEKCLNIAKKKGVLNMSDLSKYEIGNTNDERKVFLEKMQSMYGGSIELNRKGFHQWIYSD